MRPKFAIVVSRGFPATNRKEKLPSFSYTRASARSLSLCDPNTHQNLHRLVTVTDGDVGGNLFVTADTEGTHGVTGLGEDRLLAGELLQHLKIEERETSSSSSVFEVFRCCARSSQTTPSRAGIPRANLL